MNAARAQATLVGVGAAILLAACGSSGPGSGSASSPTPSPSPSPSLIASVDCSQLVTVADASTAAGADVAYVGSTAGFCLYSSSDDKTVVGVLAQAYPDMSVAQSVQPQQVAAALSGSTLGTSKVVTGIGDKAVEYNISSTNGQNGIVIFVFKANVVLMIAVTPSSNPAAVEQLAKTAVSNLH